MQKRKMALWGGLTNSCKKRRSESKGEKERYTHLNAAKLSHFSRVQLCATPYRATYQSLPSLGFSRQEHWSGLPFPSPMHESEKGK